MKQTRIAFHIGAHCTDEGLLPKSLMKNAKLLMDNGIAAPPPGRYRPVIREVRSKLQGERASEDTQDVLFEQILDMDAPERLVMSYDVFLCPHPMAFKQGALYPKASRSTRQMRNLFPDNPVEFFLAVRNPATFLPALYDRVKDQVGTFRDFTRGMDPDALVWADMVRAIREANPDAPVTVWCNEDTPLIWPEVLHEVSGLDRHHKMMGGFDILNQIMAKEGIKRLRAYLAEHPPANEIQRRRVLSAFLDKYALAEEVEEELDLPGWTPELVDYLTDVYDDDLLEISHIPGVTVLTA